MPNSNALAAETRAVVVAFLAKWADAKVLTYKFSVYAETSRENRDKVQVVFSKPTPELPAPPAVAHFCFHLDETLRLVTGFTIESNPHFHALSEIRFHERVIDDVIKRKLLVKQQNLVNLNDEFASTRVPSAIAACDEERRSHNRETLEESLLEMFQRKDPYNDGRIAFVDFSEVLHDLKLPGIHHQQRQILFAFAEQDRDEMVDYASFVPTAADVLDTLSHAHQSEADAKDATERAQEAEEAYHVLVAREVDYSIEQLNKLLQPHTSDRQREASAPAAESETDGEAALVVSASTASLSTDPGYQRAAEASDVAGDQVLDDDVLAEDLSPNKPSAYVTRRQLRHALESPQLLVSKGEINLILGLAEVTPDGRILCSQLGELFPRVRSLVFQFQRQCFGDRLEKYLLQQLSSYESGCLQGSSEHMRFRLKQKDFNLVVKDMTKLLLTPYQLMRVLAVCGGSSDVERVVEYKRCIPLMAQSLREQVDLDAIIHNAVALQRAQDSLSCDATRVLAVPSEEVLKQSSLECFEQLDAHKLGVLSTKDFFSSLAAVASLHEMALDGATDMAQLYALADPNASGRVNYMYFLQILHPLLRYIQQERMVQCGWASARAQSKAANDDDDTETKGSK
ncbi:hypothetical protein PybrP1_000060 [[Pythium] brassicae (nom. inval.)]|nr:hypothetical protein PybrP1_000060 [[Pythium] brassicae (nom. inval.)]